MKKCLKKWEQLSLFFYLTGESFIVYMILKKFLEKVIITKMKKIILIICIIFAPALCYSQPAITFNELSHNFGVVNQKDRIEHIFEFANKGDQELVIEKVSAS